jgi:predicted MFS family arabinose efflux permease
MNTDAHYSARANRQLAVSQRQLKTGYFVIEGINSFATTFFFFYFYFFMQLRFGFGNKANLILAALNGLAYALASWWGGRFAQRAGYFKALKLGFGIMLVALLSGARLESATGRIVAMVMTVVGTSFIWPAIEALVSEGESPAGIQRMVGTYNVTWAGNGALAYFTGGAMLEKLGMDFLFYLPAAIVAVQLAVVFQLQNRIRSAHPQAATATLAPPASEPHRRSPAKAKVFLRMAWLANPFAYVAINTAVAVMPGVAKRLDLSPMFAGFCCSVWCFARMGAFFALWFWPSWHYRFRWLLTSFVTLIGAFASILLVPNLVVLLVAQLFFGVALGLIYYSSLFYSMDVGETKGEHGGLHEAAIGAGNLAGPAVGAASLHFLPQYPSSAALAVCALLVCGLGGLLAVWWLTKT